MAQEMTIDQAVDGLLGQMDQQPVEPPQEQQAETGVSDVPAESEETLGDAAGEESEVSEGDAGEVEEPQEDLYEVLVDGEKKQVTLADLTANYKRQQSLDRNIREAKQRQQSYEEQLKQAQEESRQANEQRAAFIKAIEQMQQRLGSIDEVPEPDPQLQHTDPIQYQQQQIEALKHKQHIQELEQKRNEEMQAYYAEINKQREQALAVEEDLLLQNLPEWEDPSVRTQEQAKIIKFAQDRGYGPQQIQNFNHRDVLILRDAMQFQERMETGKQVVAQKVKQAAPTIAQGRALKAKPKDATQKAFDRFAKVADGGAIKSVDAINAAADFLVARREAKR